MILFLMFGVIVLIVWIFEMWGDFLFVLSQAVQGLYQDFMHMKPERRNAILAILVILTIIGLFID